MRAARRRETDRWTERVLLVAVCLAVGWFYLWTVRSNATAWRFGQEQRDHYNLLIDGWLAGQLHLKVDVAPALLALPDPYDPAARPKGQWLHDASFYRGKYFLYFGAAPVVTLMLPFRVLTGTDLPLPAAVLVFTYAAFLVAAATWLAVRRRYFSETGPLVKLLGVIALGLTTLAPVLLRRPDMWELPIAGGFFFAMVALRCVWQSLHTPRGLRWAAAAALSLGLAIASRPTYLVATPLLGLPLIAWWRETRRWPWREALALVGPLACVGVALAWHNHARFGNALEFGQAYQFSLEREGDVQHFTTRFIPHNVRLYFFEPAHWTRYFPFIAHGTPPLKPEGFGRHSHDHVFGVLRNMPLLWLALVAPLALWRREETDAGRLAAWLGSVALLLAGPAFLLACFFGNLARYLLDFTPALALLAGLGLLALERRLLFASATARLVARIAWGSALGVSAVFAVLFSFEMNGIFRERNPAGYAAMARVLNRVPAFLERVTGERHGAWELELRLPADKTTGAETLLSIGEPPHVDRVFVRYLDARRVQIGFARLAMPELVSEPLALARDQPHRLRISLGGLLPPAAHPIFEGLSADDVRRVSRVLRIDVNGATVVEAHRRFDRFVGARMRVASRALGDSAMPRFSGELLTSRRAELDLAATLARARQNALPLYAGKEIVVLNVVFPRERTGAREPLLVTGRTGEGDIVGVEYLDEQRIRFVFDHWGSPLVVTEPIRLDYALPHHVSIRMESLAATGEAVSSAPEREGPLWIDLDAQPVVRQTTAFYTCDPEEVAAGQNPVGGSHVGPAFTGEIRSVRREPR
jgi:4-amino-4-deoxy-L-arabinose transferase-like glycosyltransferase